MLFHMVQSVRAESIGATARQSMDGAERGTPVENLKTLVSLVSLVSNKIPILKSNNSLFSGLLRDIDDIVLYLG